MIDIKIRIEEVGGKVCLQANCNGKGTRNELQMVALVTDAIEAALDSFASKQKSAVAIKSTSEVGKAIIDAQATKLGAKPI